MRRNVINTFCLAVLLLFVCCILGCARYMGGRFYSGPPLPKNEISLIQADTHCYIYDIRNDKENDKKRFNLVDPLFRLELLPGQYIAGIVYRKISNTITTAGPVEIKLNLQAGNIYIIYSEITGPSGNQTWRPIFVNINDYNKEECEKYNGRWSCPDKDVISKWATKYLQGERRILNYHPSKFVDLKGKPYNVGDYWD